MLCFVPRGEPKKVSAHEGLNPQNITFNKGATKLYFMHDLHVVIFLFSTDLFKSAFYTYLFGKLGFCFSLFWLFMFLYLWFLAFIFFVLCFEFNVILNNIPQLSSHFI